MVKKRNQTQHYIFAKREENNTFYKMYSLSFPVLFLDWDVVNPIPWKPVLDNFSTTPFLPMSFEESIKTGNFPPDVPFVAGFTSEEGLVRLTLCGVVLISDVGRFAVVVRI